MVAWLVVLLSAAALAYACWVAAVMSSTAFDWWISSQPTLFLLLGGVGLVWAATGAFLITLRPRNLLGWLFVAPGASIACSVAVSAYAVTVGGVDPYWSCRGCGPTTWTWTGVRVVLAIGASLYDFGPIFLTTVTLAFYPHGRLPSPWWRWPVAGAVLGTLLRTTYTVLETTVGDGRAAYLYVMGLLLLIPSMLAIFAGTIVRLVRARAPQRQQLAWLVCVV